MKVFHYGDTVTNFAQSGAPQFNRTFFLEEVGSESYPEVMCV